MLPVPDTIAAIATARGRAALAVLRLSGPEALPIAAACFQGRDLTTADSHTVHVGYVLDEAGRPIDQVVATVFRAPRSVTGEDVVEWSCHGGDFAASLLLERLMGAGARMAAPGEFTQRAFLNGKMDLAQAEAVADLIHASSSLAHRVSVAQLQGRYSALLSRLRDELLETCAYVELELDFSDEDVEFADRTRLEGLLDRAQRLLADLLASYTLGERLRDGVRVVIAGRPNAGKSTLLNALVGRDRAIVSPAPGTTRDEIEAEVEIKGLRFRFVDTAGLRDAGDEIEAEGVRRAHRAIETSDVLLYVVDRTRGLAADERALLGEVFAEVRRQNAGFPVLLVVNKADLPATGPEVDLPGLPSVQLSAKEGLGEAALLEPLVDWLVDAVGGDLSRSETSPVVTNRRHSRHLQCALDAVTTASHALQAGASGDTLALDLRVALHELGAITGAITNEDVLDQIFSRFCIGK